MIPVAAEVVLYRLLNLQRDVSGVGQRLLDSGRSKRRHLLGECVARINIRCVMTIMMNHHGLRVDVRLERVECITKRRQFERRLRRLSKRHAR